MNVERKMAYEATRAMMDALMGANRDGDKDIKVLKWVTPRRAQTAESLRCT